MNNKPLPPQPPAQPLGFPFRQGLKLLSLLFGAMCVARVVSVALHELGHAIPIWLMGGNVRDFYLNPFHSSYVVSAGFGQFPLPALVAGGGYIFGPILCLGIFYHALRIRRHATFIFVAGLTTAYSFFRNGYYVWISLLFRSGDAHNLRYIMGADPWFLMFFGLALVVVGLVFSLELYYHLGLDRYPRVSMISWLMIGLMPYAVLDEIYDYWVQGIFIEAIPFSLLYLVFIMLNIHLLPSAAHWKWLNRNRPPGSFLQEVPWWKVLVVLLAGLALVAGELVLFGPPRW